MCLGLGMRRPPWSKRQGDNLVKTILFDVVVKPSEREHRRFLANYISDDSRLRQFDFSC